MVTRRRIVAMGTVVAAGLATVGCGPKSGGKKDVSWTEPQPGSSATPAAPAAGPVTVTVTPATDTRSVSPEEQVTVSVRGGTLSAVTLTAGDQKVSGTLADEHNWRSTGNLRYGKKYTVTATVVDSAGTTSEHKSTFTTVKPSGIAEVTFQANRLAALKTGGTYGVGQPVIVYFSRSVKDRAAAEKAMEVETSPAVEGRWRWIDGQHAHWRPAEYWKPGTRITVRVKLFGKNLGRGVYGTDASTHFTIGPSRIAIADSKTKRMKCYIDGKLVRDIPVSLGKGGIVTTPEGKEVNYWTRSGVHVIMTKEPSHRMRSASYGVTDPKDPNYYDEIIKLCSRISYSGEFVHMADWNISAHGHRNTSHGCINVGPSNAKWFFETFQLGDVVDVRNTPRKMALTDGIGDWTVPWNEW